MVSGSQVGPSFFFALTGTVIRHSLYARRSCRDAEWQAQVDIGFSFGICPDINASAYSQYLVQLSPMSPSDYFYNIIHL